MRSYADGCEAGYPVGYGEGWYVAENWPQQSATNIHCRRREHSPNYVGRFCSQGHTNPEFVSASRHTVGHDAIKPHSGEGQRKNNWLICGRPWYERDNGAARFPQVMYNFGRGFLLLSWLKKQR